MCIYMNLYLFVCTVCIIVVLFMVLENRYATLDTEIKVEYSAFLLGCRQSRTITPKTEDVSDCFYFVIFEIYKKNKVSDQTLSMQFLEHFELLVK